MKICIESNQITIRDRKNIDTFYGVPVKCKNLDNDKIEYDFNICINNKFFVGKYIMPYIKQDKNKEINGFEVTIKNNDLIRQIGFINDEFRITDNKESSYMLVYNYTFGKTQSENAFEFFNLGSIEKSCLSL